MAGKKTRKNAWRIKYVFAYLAVVGILITLLVLTIMSGIPGKVLAIIYESFLLLFAVGVPIASEIVYKKESKKKVQYGISKEEYQEFIRQTKNSDFCAK